MAIGLYLNNRKKIDLLISISIPLACFIFPLAKISFFKWPSVSESATLNMAIFGTSATLLGFVIASATFLIAHVKSPEFEILRKSKSYPQLIAISSESMWRLAALMVVSLVMAQSDKAHVNISNMLVIFTCCYAACGLFCLMWMTLAVLKVPARPPQL